MRGCTLGTGRRLTPSLRGGGGGSKALHFGKNDFELGVARDGQARTRPDILKVVLGPYVQYCQCEALEQKPGQKLES